LWIAAPNLVSSAWFFSSIASPYMGLGSGSGRRCTESMSWSWCSVASKCSSSILVIAPMSPGPHRLDLLVVLALTLDEVPDADRLLLVVDDQLALRAHRALVDAEDAQLARRACRS
jgi:hypothetical protein